MDHRHETQPCCNGWDVARRRIEYIADRMRSTRLQVYGEHIAWQRQLDNVDKSRRRLPVLQPTRTDHPAARHLDVWRHVIQGGTQVSPLHQIQRRHRLHLPTRLMQRDTVILRRLLWPAGRLPSFSVPPMITSDFNIHFDDTTDLAENSNLLHRLSITSPSLSMKNDPWKGHGYSHVTNFRLLHLLKYLWNI